MWGDLQHDKTYGLNVRDLLLSIRSSEDRQVKPEREFCKG